jgi:hypothetical protein
MGKDTRKQYLAFLANVKDGTSEAVSLDIIPDIPVVLPSMNLEGVPNFKIYDTDKMPEGPEEVVTIGNAIIPVAEIRADYEEQIKYRSSCLPHRIGRTNLLFSIYSKNGQNKDNPFNSSHDDHHPLHSD